MGRESLLVKDQRSTTVQRRQPVVSVVTRIGDCHSVMFSPVKFS